MSPLLVATAVGGSACTTTRDDGLSGFASADGSGGDLDEDAGASDEDSDADASDVGDGTDTSDDDGPKFDVQSGNSRGGDADDGATGSGCEAVDFLFVIDNSGSMGPKQQNLADNFPNIIAAIQSTVGQASDYHVMVVSTDEEWSESCEYSCGFSNDCFPAPGYTCGYQPPLCDRTLGSGKLNVFDRLDHADARRECNFVDGHRYITPNDADLAAAFECSALLGTSGNLNERQVDALRAAVSPTLTGAGGCNAGFIRDEAILVVTIISDEEDLEASGNVTDWVQDVLDAKQGDPDGVVMMGLLDDADLPGGLCTDVIQTPVKLRQFVEAFPNHFLGSVCAPDYSTVLSQAASIVESSCDNYVPPAG